MDELLKQVKKELKEIGEKGITAANLEVAYKLVDIAKDIGEIKEQERGEKEEEGGNYGMRDYRGGYPYEIPGPYMEGGYGARGNYREGGSGGYGARGGGGGNYREGGNYGEGGYGARGNYREGGYGARGGSYRTGNYGHDKLAECLDRIADGMDMYSRDKEHYHGNDQRVVEGLEMMMYGICMFVESAMDFAETPEEKEVIRKHLRKIQSA